MAWSHCHWSSSFFRARQASRALVRELLAAGSVPAEKADQGEADWKQRGAHFA